MYSNYTENNNSKCTVTTQRTITVTKCTVTIQRSQFTGVKVFLSK